METELIVKSIMGLIALLSLLVFFLFLEPNKDKKKPNSNSKVVVDRDEVESEETNLDALVAIIKNKKSDSKKLSFALDMILKHHGTFHKKMGVRAHKDFDIYMDVLFTLCRHPNTNKDLIINFDKELARLNPDYKQEINNAISKGLNSRGI
ncbi:hypothetical protein Suden_0041 [Sulfurimonas denitrificans DSM 1251]|jgi:hypothetical protein|uniref:Uncharacterized protein n=1 Tax=Sulfurimonas denitrificans (strain ATCC 33889 / DSM 1251) TaxID=326298 RepID=Q30UK9_SULDN|nr:hypothetical protein [Sulfurimonas denitrificans]ABB43322.1 hypothetical protein Suden_0041 [Sulfurimonas denitrificans DSM 1251]MDD3442326.1 hypothetical protein [Sulfurimonas denitrificans]